MADQRKRQIQLHRSNSWTSVRRESLLRRLRQVRRVRKLRHVRRVWRLRQVRRVRQWYQSKQLSSWTSLDNTRKSRAGKRELDKLKLQRGSFIAYVWSAMSTSATEVGTASSTESLTATPSARWARQDPANFVTMKTSESKRNVSLIRTLTISLYN